MKCSEQTLPSCCCRWLQLANLDVYSLPDSFAVVIVDLGQTHTTSVNSSLALTSLPSNDYTVAVRQTTNRSTANRVYNASAYAASVNSTSKSVSDLYSLSIHLSRASSSHITSSESEVTTPIMAIPTSTITPGTHLEQQSPLNISTRPVSSGNTSTANHPQNPLAASGKTSRANGRYTLNKCLISEIREIKKHNDQITVNHVNRSVDNHYGQLVMCRAGLGSKARAWLS